MLKLRTALLRLLIVCAWWFAAICALLWAIEQQHLLGTIGLPLIGGGAIAYAVVRTVKEGKGIFHLYSPPLSSEG